MKLTIRFSTAGPLLALFLGLGTLRSDEPAAGPDAAATTPETTIVRGDSNGDRRVNISDPVHTLSYLFLGGDEPPCLKAADSDDNGRLELTDPIGTLSYLFVNGDLPAENFGMCWPDPTEDGLSCDQPAVCGSGTSV